MRIIILKIVHGVLLVLGKSYKIKFDEIKMKLEKNLPVKFFFPLSSL